MVVTRHHACPCGGHALPKKDENSRLPHFSPVLCARKPALSKKTVFRPVSTIRNKGLMRPVSGERRGLEICVRTKLRTRLCNQTTQISAPERRPEVLP